MACTRLFLALTAILLGAGIAGAEDLTKIERKIGKEPKYTGQPRYCLLVFGPEAKFRVWLVQDGNTLYVDRNGNGDLTEPGERMDQKGSLGGGMLTFAAGELKDGKLTHRNLSVSTYPITAESVNDDKEFQRIAKDNPEKWTWWVGINAERAVTPGDKLPARVSYIANGDGLGYLVFGTRPQDAPIIHFNGPWTLGWQDRKQQLEVGKQTELQIGVGTHGVGPGTFSFVEYPGLIPDTAYPVAEITFPSNGPTAEPRRYTLKKRC